MEMKSVVRVGLVLFASAAGVRAQDVYFNFCISPSRVEKRTSTGALLWTTTGGSGTEWLGASVQAGGDLLLTCRSPTVALERFDSSGTFLSLVATPEIAPYQGDLDVFADGTVAICDYSGNQIELYSQSGSHVGAIQQAGLAKPFGCCIDQLDHLWVLGIPNYPTRPTTVSAFDRSGALLQSFSTNYCAGDLVVDPAGDLWVIDYPGTVHHLTNTGSEISSFSTGLPGPCWGIARLDDGSLWVGSFSSNTPLHFSSSGALLGSFATASTSLTFIRTERQCSMASNYCTAGTSSFGCNAHLSATGFASASAATSFTITAHGVDGLKQGMIFYGISGPLATPWGAGGSSYSCVKPPQQRTGSANSGGTFGACDGQYLFDWNSFFAAHPGALGTPLQAGETFHVQAWWRDPGAVKSASLSDAIFFNICP
jgi:hypothetical protein